MARAFFLALTVVALVAMGVGGCVKAVQFQGQCEDYLKLAGDAPTVDKAVGYLRPALDYLERNDMTRGNCAFFFRNPSSDMGLWYGNIKGAYDEAQALLERQAKNPTSVTSVDRSNLLIKIREVVIDNGSEGHTVVTSPGNAWLYPFQWLWVIGWAVFVLLGLCTAGANYMANRAY